MTRVTIISAFHNRAEHIRDSVQSLLDQTHDDLEIILCDDGSTDETLRELQAFSDPRLIVMTQENAGLVETLNRMVARASGEYIAVHGSGDISLPERIARQASLLDADDRVGVVGCLLERGGGIYRPEGWDRTGPQPLFETMLRDNPFTHGEVMFRKSLFDKVGGYRPVFRYAQDCDLWFRIGRHADYQIVPEVLYQRFNLTESVSRSPERLVLQRKLAAFAGQCAKTTDGEGRDLVDRYGELGLMFAQPQRATANMLARIGLQFVRRGDVAGGRALLHSARREHANLVTFVASALARIPENSRFWKVLSRII